MPADPSLDHLIGALQERGRDRQAEGLGGLEVDYEFERDGLLDGKIRGFRALQYLMDVGSGPSMLVGETRSISHDASRLGCLPVRRDGGQTMLHRQARYVRPKREEQRITEHEEGSCAILGRGNEPL